MVLRSQRQPLAQRALQAVAPDLRRELVAAALQAMQRRQIPSSYGRTCPCQGIGVWFLQRSRIVFR